MTTIWHNPRCSKSRQTLALLAEKGIDPEVRLYLADPPSEAELIAVLDQLGLGSRDLIRKGETAYKEAGPRDADDAALIAAMAANPALIERPVVIHGGRAALGRPPQNVLQLF